MRFLGTNSKGERVYVMQDSNLTCRIGNVRARKCDPLKICIPVDVFDQLEKCKKCDKVI
ncbi:hypothetical protein OD91_0881 [Lutibacter sp. Hel_I_33_5]|uniref:hypothetical protein n=1 Tax=Lutibacter sp. Hel_I_33_5 TaxID=1566289 RepID=UPI0011AC7E0F|nr:hypothetical protein [Lutibacter sp. Hel_I_33_5]TVZ55626.1 hypothetical protein OD91_0881 [Lutibacter sp. Hel_I_33_5]